MDEHVVFADFEGAAVNAAAISALDGVVPVAYPCVFAAGC